MGSGAPPKEAGSLAGGTEIPAVPVVAAYGAVIGVWCSAELSGITGEGGGESRCTSGHSFRGGCQVWSSPERSGITSQGDRESGVPVVTACGAVEGNGPPPTVVGSRATGIESPGVPVVQGGRWVVFYQGVLRCARRYRGPPHGEGGVHTLEGLAVVLAIYMYQLCTYAHFTYPGGPPPPTMGFGRLWVTMEAL